MERRGSQLRVWLSETGFRLLGRPGPGLVVLADKTTGERELWSANDDHAGYTLQIGRWGYEYVTDLKEHEYVDYHA